MIFLMVHASIIHSENGTVSKADDPNYFPPYRCQPKPSSKVTLITNINIKKI